jgi:hypothetical protein
MVNSILLRKVAFLLLTAFLLMILAGTLTVRTGGGVRAEERPGVPLDTKTAELLKGTHLDFIAETGRVVVNERGVREIIWELPELPTVSESVEMYQAAVRAKDTSLLPLCTDAFLAYVKQQKEAGSGFTEGASGASISKSPSISICNAIPDQAAFGKAGAPAGSPLKSTSNPDLNGYYYVGSSVAEGINGAITRDDPSLNTGELAAARFLAQNTVLA